VTDFLHGAITLASATIGLFFLRYWRSSGDRLFVMFSAAFWLLSLHWLLSSVLPQLETHAHVLRFAAFVLIALAVLDKNRIRKR
jgi:hypothetical protein